MNNEKLHYKMYKAGKRWMFAGIATLLVSGGVLSGARPVAADTAVATTSTQATTEQSHADSTSAAATTSDSTAQATSEMPASATITSEALLQQRQRKIQQWPPLRNKPRTISNRQVRPVLH
ncbi:KxYKxGKxW signal peptide domain-containing protein [Fructilactobacillus florum]|uniref:KxYKxGKxW signal peptide domain-containing protein n=1 Tax=Fructilactobacillus florum TaxID=640331 RepID=UPI0006CF3ABB|nr:KxYKxGKxW signal peptide domain-containing protein [Fructilactobacillus florum]